MLEDKPRLIAQYSEGAPVLKSYVLEYNLVFLISGKVHCELCRGKCSGNALRVGEKYFHVNCFKCAQCGDSLAQGGFFFKAGKYYCTKDYQKSFGTKCEACKKFVEGDVVTALGNTYHTACFVCARCKQPFPSGEKVTYTGKECLCVRCIQIPVKSESPLLESKGDCAGCGDALVDGQALVALDKQWHIYCFKCTACGQLLHGEYMSKDDQPYCEKDYQTRFGVKCAHCQRYITGKVLQAGEDSHFHPTCARCSKCGDPFGDGEEMYLQAGAIWHPRCGPRPNGDLEHPEAASPTSSSRCETPLNSSASIPLHHYDYSMHDRSTTPMLNDLSRVYACSYLTQGPTLGYLRRPLQPNPPKSPNFHQPPHHDRKVYGRIHINKQGMQVLVDSLAHTGDRVRSPHMNNEEPIELALYPDAKKPQKKQVPPIERDDFPAPPYPYADPTERIRRSSVGSDTIDREDQVDLASVPADPKLKKEEEELEKISSGIGKVFLKTVKEREKMRAYKMTHIDPRNASRVPSASREIAAHLRYDNPVNASPSRDLDRPRPWELDPDFDRNSILRGSARPHDVHINYNVVSSLHQPPKPGYGLSAKSATLPAGTTSHYATTMTSHSANPFKTASSDFGSDRSDGMSIASSDVRSKSAMNHSRSGEGQAFCGMRHASYSPHLRRSMPNVNWHLSQDPPRLYPYHLLCTANYRLPGDVDRCHLERHLSNQEFDQIFHMDRLQFYRLPEWRRNDLKRRARLF
ncbi:actin-binding LIM protein 3 [Galendromus occidentalis]|uniref:Actin-binding LIM protein 3 n=1 Tax=Galendromus occidentalis TaxID=34638 RepID=A0AAJ7SFD3_9ACAR|nr:actin-binding LIM protein 3 [Galendromus occidentalis]